MSRIRARLARSRDEASGPAPEPAPTPPIPAPLAVPEVSSVPAEELPVQAGERGCHVNDLLDLDHGRLVRNAFGVLYGRAPAPDDAARYEHALHSGTLTPLELIHELRYNSEGRTHGVRVRGLRSRVAYTRVCDSVPVFGSLLRWTVDLLRLPSRLAGLREEIRVSRHRTAGVEQSVSSSLEAIELALGEITRVVNLTLEGLRSRATAAETAELRHHLARLEAAKAEAEAIHALLTDVAGTRSLSRQLARLEHRLRTERDRDDDWREDVESRLATLRHGAAGRATAPEPFGAPIADSSAAGGERPVAGLRARR